MSSIHSHLYSSTWISEVVADRPYMCSMRQGEVIMEAQKGMIIYAVTRHSRSVREWHSFYASHDEAATMVNVMNARIHRNTTPYAVTAVTLG